MEDKEAKISHQAKGLSLRLVMERAISREKQGNASREIGRRLTRDRAAPHERNSYPVLPEENRNGRYTASA